MPANGSRSRAHAHTRKPFPDLGRHVSPAPTELTHVATDPGSYVVSFGKHRGETIAAVYSSDPQYLDWVATPGQRRGVFGEDRSQELRVLATVVRLFIARVGDA